MKKKLPFWMKVLWGVFFPGLIALIVLIRFELLNIHQHPFIYLYTTISFFAALIWSIIYSFSIVSAIILRKKIEWTLSYILTLLFIIGIISSFK